VNKTQILKEYDQYTDSWGLIQDNNQQDTSGNGIRYTTEALIVFKKYDLLDNTQRQRFITALDRCELQPGLLMRTPLIHLDIKLMTILHQD